MASENKFSLLASLTASLPTTTDSNGSETMPHNEILSSNEGSQHNSDSDNDNGEVVFMQDPIDDVGQGTSAKNTNGTNFLSASGLLTGSGGGLFDQVDKEEEEKERALAAAERERRIQEEMKAQQAAQAQRQLELEQKQAQEAREEQMKQDELLQQQRQAAELNQQHGPSSNNHMNNVGMQHLSLQDPLSVQPTQQYQNAHLTQNMGASMPHQAPTYSNASPIVPNNPHQTIHQAPPQQPIQQADFGGSYYYSTSGNVQQKFNSPNSMPSSVGVNLTNGNRSDAMNGVDPNMTDPGMSPGVNHYDNSKLLSPNTNGIAPPIPQIPNTATSSSYSMRSQMRQVNSPPRHVMPAVPPPPTPNMNGNGQEFVPHPAPVAPRDLATNAPPVQHYDPANFKPVHGVITISDPILVQSPGVFSGPPYWTYAVTVRDVNVVEGQEEYSKVVNSVRRRFRHFDALEQRLRADRPGSILPPRPNKHTARAINEATTSQSPQFALQRAAELEIYLNALRLHPYAGNSPVLSLFLTLPDHLGVAWPEVSASIFTRLSEVGTNTAVKVAEGTSAVLAEMNHEHSLMAGEDSSELLRLAASEGIRIGSVLQAVPKLEGGITSFSNLATLMSTNGLELQKLVNQAFFNEKEVAAPFEILANGLLRSARRTSRLAVELAAANQVFQSQYKLCKYERLAFADRRSALGRRREARKEADIKARKLVSHQHTMHMGTGRYLNASANATMGTPYGQSPMSTPYGQAPYGQASMGGGTLGMGHPMTDKLEMEASVTDEFAVEAVQDADAVGRTLLNEVARIERLRRTEWSANLRIMASSMREAHAERVAIWEGCQTVFLNEFPAGDQLDHHEADPTYLPEADIANVGLTAVNGNGMTPIAEDGARAFRQSDYQNEQQQNLTQTVS